jgi:hypothetical protein
MTEIFLPTRHKCGESCEFVYVLGYRTNKKNPHFKNGECDKKGEINKHESPRLASVTDELWADSKNEGDGSFLNANDVVIPDKNIVLQISYPLSGGFDFPLESKNGFTRKQLVDCIVKTYKTIYAEEEATVQEQPVVEEKDRATMDIMLNRNQTDGKYGIWGHDFGDLWLEGIRYDADKKVVSLAIGS